MNVYDQQEPGVKIIIRRDSADGILRAHSEGSPQGRRQVEPLVEFFRNQQPWPGRGKITIIIKNPSAVEDAFSTPGVVPGYPELRQQAAIKWDARPPLWKTGDALHIWKSMVETALHGYLKATARSTRPDRFASQPIKTGIWLIANRDIG